MSVGQGIMAGVIGHTFKFVWEMGNRWRVKRMEPEQFKEWRAKQLAKIKKEAVSLADIENDKGLKKLGIKRADLVRLYEVIFRNKRGIELSQNLLEGMDIRGLDLHRLKGLKQEHIDSAIGNAATKLPDYIQVPEAWRGRP